MLCLARRNLGDWPIRHDVPEPGTVRIWDSVNSFLLDHRTSLLSTVREVLGVDSGPWGAEEHRVTAAVSECQSRT